MVVEVASSFFGAIGRATLGKLETMRKWLAHVSSIWHLLVLSAYYATVAPLRGKSKLRPQLAPLMRSVGVLSFPIVAVVNVLIGAILVLQTGEVMEQYGQIRESPGAVALSVTRELGPLMVAVVMTARVGASYTAVLAAMKLNEEIMALETMGIHPVGYLVAPRVLSMVIMMPCLTMLALLLGMLGGAVVAKAVYAIPFDFYMDKTFQTLNLSDLGAGMLKAVVFSVLISIICCYFGLIAKGGPMGLGRYIMVAVVTSLTWCLFAVAAPTFLVSLTLFPAEWAYRPKSAIHLGR